jgi:hypothetical protein
LECGAAAPLSPEHRHNNNHTLEINTNNKTRFRGRSASSREPRFDGRQSVPPVYRLTPDNRLVVVGTHSTGPDAGPHFESVRVRLVVALVFHFVFFLSFLMVCLFFFFPAFWPSLSYFNAREQRLQKA